MSARNEFEALKMGLHGLAEQGYITKEQPEEEETFVPPSSIQFNAMDGEGYDYSQQHYHEEQPQQNFTSQEEYFEGEYTPVDEHDERLWPGGPLKSEVESWKRQYSDIYLADDIDPNQVFIYRTINRYEYKAIVAALNTDPLMREEMICEQCVLFPYEYSYGIMSNGNAGNVTTLSEQILITSGFTKASMPRRL